MAKNTGAVVHQGMSDQLFLQTAFKFVALAF